MLLTADLVERWWSASGRASSFPGGDLIALLRNDCGDLAATQQASSDSAGVGPVGDHRSWMRAGTAALAGHHDLIEHRGEHCAVVALAPGNHDRQWPAVAVDGGVDLGGQPAPGPSDPMTCGFTLAPRQIRVIRSSPLCLDQVALCSSHADVLD